MVGWLLARGHRKLRGVCVRASSSPSRPSIQPSRLYEGTPPHATSCCIPSRKSGPTLNGCTRRPDCRNVCISPTAIVVLPTPELVPATTMVGTLAVGSAVRTRMTADVAGNRGTTRMMEDSANRAREVGQSPLGCGAGDGAASVNRGTRV